MWLKNPIGAVSTLLDIDDKRWKDPERASITECMEYDGLTRPRQSWLNAARYVDEHNGYTSPENRTIRVNGPSPESNGPAWQ